MQGETQAVISHAPNMDEKAAPDPMQPTSKAVSDQTPQRTK